MDILWWEKTVEYFFVQKYVDIKTFVAPLDGNHENVGDAIFSNESMWILIEFKRDKKSISDELGKFINFAEAKEALESEGAHHLIIYGESESADFYLKCQQYFSGLPILLEDALKSGIEKDLFVKYLQKLIEYKKQSQGGSGGYGFVAGVSNDGTVTRCMKLSEFAEALHLEKILKQKLQQRPQQSSYSRPRMGR
ncbi:hypothetical protein [Vogesella sp. LIG4]|uniref:hypothetical protein n=1 Tax=Vogesella sp. LIG4 TaxID=1192162 RepID=UPI0012FE076D|nr:hypothetical protein [Vogesella sp. LIG4]